MKKMNWRLLGTLLMILAVTDDVWSAPDDALIVKADAPECQDKGETLFCDYKSGNQKPVYLKKLDNSTVGKVFIYSALDLHIIDDACVDVVIHNAKGAKVIKSSNNECKRKTSLSATKSDFKTIETRIGTLNLDDSRVNKLVLDSELFELTVKKTEINVLDVSGKTERGATALIQDTQINNLERLFINHGSKWVIQTSQIGKLNPKGLEIADGTLTITDSSIKAVTEDSLMFKDFHGSLTLAGIPNKDSRTGNVTESQRSTSFLALFCLCLILLLLSWIIFIVYLNKERILKNKTLALLAKSNAKDSGQKSNIESNATFQREHVSNYANTSAVKENEELLKNNKDTTEQLTTQGAANEKQIQGTMQIIRSPDNVSTQKIRDHLGHLQKHLSELKGTFQAFSFTAQYQSKILVPYKMGQRRKDPSGFYEQLKNLLISLTTRNDNYSDTYEQESKVSSLAETTMALGAKKPHSQIASLPPDGENTNEHCNNSQRTIMLVEDIVKKHEEELIRLINTIGKAVKKSDLEKAAGKYKWPKEYKLPKLYYCLPQDLLDSILDEISEIEVKSLQQCLVLLNGNIQRAERLLLLIINILITFTSVLLEEANRQ